MLIPFPLMEMSWPTLCGFIARSTTGPACAVAELFTKLKPLDETSISTTRPCAALLTADDAEESAEEMLDDALLDAFEALDEEPFDPQAAAIPHPSRSPTMMGWRTRMPGRFPASPGLKRRDPCQALRSPP